MAAMAVAPHTATRVPVVVGGGYNSIHCEQLPELGPTQPYVVRPFEQRKLSEHSDCNLVAVQQSVSVQVGALPVE